MVEVHLWTGLTRFTGGKAVVAVEAATIGQMLDALKAAYPGLAPTIDAGVSVAIDGRIINGGRHNPIGAGNEIHLLQQMKGG